MTEGQILRAIVEGAEIYFRSFALPGMIHRNENGVEWVKPGHGKNGPAVVFGVHLSNDKDIEDILTKVKNDEIPALWVLSPLSAPKNALDILVEAGFSNLSVKDQPELGMALELFSDWETPEPNSAVEVKRIDSIPSFKKWIEITNTVLHGGDLLTIETHTAWLESTAYTFYLGYMNGIPVSTAAVLQSEGGRTASLEFVATLAEYRRLGAAYAVCAKALSDQRSKGIPLVTLRSSHEGVELYKRLQFQPYYEQQILLYHNH